MNFDWPWQFDKIRQSVEMLESRIPESVTTETSEDSSWTGCSKVSGLSELKNQEEEES